MDEIGKFKKIFGESKDIEEEFIRFIEIEREEIRDIERVVGEIESKIMRIDEQLADRMVYLWHKQDEIEKKN